MLNGLCFAPYGDIAQRDGHKLSAIDRDSNDLADRLAKSQALGMRVPREVRKQLLKIDLEVFNVAKWLAIVTVEACNRTCPDGSHCRDSTAVPKRVLPVGPTTRKQKESEPPAVGSNAWMKRLYANSQRLSALRQRVVARL